MSAPEESRETLPAQAACQNCLERPVKFKDNEFHTKRQCSHCSALKSTLKGPFQWATSKGPAPSAIEGSEYHVPGAFPRDTMTNTTAQPPTGSSVDNDDKTNEPGSSSSPEGLQKSTQSVADTMNKVHDSLRNLSLSRDIPTQEEEDGNNKFISQPTTWPIRDPENRKLSKLSPAPLTDSQDSDNGHNSGTLTKIPSSPSSLSPQPSPRSENDRNSGRHQFSWVPPSNNQPAENHLKAGRYPKLHHRHLQLANEADQASSSQKWSTGSPYQLITPVPQSSCMFYSTRGPPYPRRLGNPPPLPTNPSPIPQPEILVDIPLTPPRITDDEDGEWTSVTQDECFDDDDWEDVSHESSEMVGWGTNTNKDPVPTKPEDNQNKEDFLSLLGSYISGRDSWMNGW